MKEWIIEDLTPEKVWAAAELQKSHYGENDDTAHASYLDYEYFQNPAGPTFGELAWNEAKRKAAGGYALTYVPIKVGREVYGCFHSANSLTRASYRGQGVYVSILRRVFERAAAGNYLLAYGMPNPNSYPIQIKKGLFEDLGPVPLYLRPLRPSGMVRSHLKSSLLAGLSRPFDGLFRPGSSAGTIFVKLSNENLELADQFWESIQGKYSVMLVRDGARLAYRFLNIPRRKYECWYALAGNKPVALAVGRKMEVAGIQCAMLADFLYLDGYEAQARALVRKVLGLLRDGGADMAGCLMLPWTAEAALLRKLGFFRCPKAMEPQPFLLCAHAFREVPGSVDPMKLENWFFTMGDYDVV